jgi:hypothetical protein
MSQRPDSLTPADRKTNEQDIQRGIALVGAVIALITVGLIVLAVVLALNANQASPAVEIVRDFLIILLAFQLAIVGTAFVVLLVQVARLLNLLTNEITPIVDAAQETVNSVRGTALFLNKYLADPVIKANSAIRGMGNVMGEVDAIRKAIDAAASAARSASPTSAHTSTQPVQEAAVHSETASDRQEPPEKTKQTRKQTSSQQWEGKRPFSGGPL